MEITATVDRIEGELAVLLLRGDENVKFNLPVVFLAGINEGDVVNIAITKDAAATDEAPAILLEKETCCPCGFVLREHVERSRQRLLGAVEGDSPEGDSPHVR